MSITTQFANALANLLSQKSTTSEYYLKPINYVALVDSNNNIIAFSTNVNVQYQNGVIFVTTEIEVSSDDTVTQIFVGNYYNGNQEIYFIATTNQQVSSGNVYEIEVDIILNNINIVSTPFESASITANKFVDLIGNILTGNPLYTGKSGHFIDALYIINTTSNVSQSYRIPIVIESITPTLQIGGILPSNVVGNELVLRDNNQNDLIVIYSDTPITFKKGRQVIIEFTFCLS